MLQAQIMATPGLSSCSWPLLRVMKLVLIVAVCAATAAACAGGATGPPPLPPSAPQLMARLERGAVVGVDEALNVTEAPG